MISRALPLGTSRRLLAAALAVGLLAILVAAPSALADALTPESAQLLAQVSGEGVGSRGVLARSCVPDRTKKRSGGLRWLATSASLHEG